MEVDHIFISAKRGAPEAERLRAFGLTEGGANVHPGQGTANRRFFFHNVFLELLWLADANEAQRPLTQPTRLYERLTTIGLDTSPFGFAFRPERTGETDAPFPHWAYRPDYLPAQMKIDVGQAPLSEPMWFFLAFGGKPALATGARRQPLEHEAGLREVTSLRLTIPTGAPLSDVARQVAAIDNLEIVRGEAHLLELGFDGEGVGRRHSFQPQLPLVFSW